MRRGDFVTIQYEGRSVAGMILLASPNGKSLMLGFDAMLGGHVGSMPVLMDHDGTYRSIVTNEMVSIKPRESS